MEKFWSKTRVRGKAGGVHAAQGLPGPRAPACRAPVRKGSAGSAQGGTRSAAEPRSCLGKGRVRRVPRGRRAWGKLRPPNGRFPGTVGQSMTVQGSPAPAPAAPMGAHCLPAEGAVPRPALPRLGPAAAGPHVGQPRTPDPGSVGRPATLPGPASVGRENQRPRTQGAAAAPRRPRRGAVTSSHPPEAV